MTTRAGLDTRLSRRTAIAAAAGAAGFVGRSLPASTRAAPFASGALGLTRAEIEARWGPGDRVDVPGHPIYDETYAYEAQGWLQYVWYLDLNGETVAAYVEVAYGSDGVPAIQARDLAERLLPDDAEFSETYIAPATPQGPTALTMTRYLSPSLGAAYVGAIPPEILVTLHEAWDDETGAGDRVTAVSIMIRMATQRG